MPSFLPPEVIQLILDQVSDRTDLARCCSTSKTFHSLTRPLLYHSVEINLRHSTVSPLASGLFQINPVSNSLLSSIRQFKHLRFLIRQVSLISYSFSDEQYITFIEVKPDTILKELLELIPLLERFFLQDFMSVLEIDSVVSQYQRKIRQEPGARGAGEEPRNGPAFSLQCSGSTIGPTLVLSKEALRSLSVPLDSLTHTSAFPSLERLTIRLFAWQGVVDELFKPLTSVSTLRALRLRGSMSYEILSKLLLEEEFAKSLPPLLSHLCLNYRLPSTHLSSFLGHLPDCTSLKRLCCLKKTGYRWESATGDSNGSGEEEMLAVVEEYRSRGIKLSFDEEYSVW